MSRYTFGNDAVNCVAPVSELKLNAGLSGSKRWSAPNAQVPGLPAAHSCVGKYWSEPPNFQLCLPAFSDSVSCASVNVVIVPVRHGQRHCWPPQLRPGKLNVCVPM